MIDKYSHDSCAIIYISECIPGPVNNDAEYEELINNFNSQITDQCNCNLCEEKCPCLLKSGGANYSSGFRGNELHLINHNRIISNSYPIYECNDLCFCSYDCKNRYVQKGPIKSLYVKKCLTESKGLGLYTSTFIPKDTFICEYAGEIITKSQAVSRHIRNQTESKMNYIFCLKEFSNNSVTKTFVDPSYLGNIGRYINHSCGANSVIVPVRVNIPIPKLAIFSCSDIEPHTEITFNYSSGTPGSTSVTNMKPCLCSAQNCTGWLPYDVY